MSHLIGRRAHQTIGAAALILASFTSQELLHAQTTLTWVGNTSTNLLTADNWNPAQAPVNNDTWVFGAAGTAGTSLTLGSARNINGFSFSSGASAYTFGGAGTYTIATGGLTNNSGTTQTFDSIVRYSTGSTFTAGSNSPVVFNGNFFGNATVDLSSTVTFNGNISGGSTALLLRFGAGIATINGASNTGLQSIKINRSQRVNIGSATGLASATTITMGSDRADAQSGAVLANTSGTPLTTGASLAVRSGTSLAAAGLNFSFGDAAHTAANSMTFTGTTAINADLTRTITLNGTGLNVTSASVWNNTVTGNRTLVINGAGNTFGIGGIAIGATDETNNIALTIGGSGNLTIAGGVTAGGGTGTRGLTVNKTSGLGTVSIGGTSDYTGATTITAGTLLVNGNQSAAIGAVTVALPATLGGTGTLGGATAVSGILAPGVGGIGTLTVANDVTWNGGGNWLFELGTAGASIGSPGTSDLLSITENNDFLKGTGSSWGFDFGGSGAVGWYKLVDWTGGTTTFAAGDFTATNLSSGYTGEFTVQNNGLYIVVVPEPGTWALAGCGITIAAGVAGYRRRRLPAGDSPAGDSPAGG
jgi:autotransporter-associated beta strand protein